MMLYEWACLNGLSPHPGKTEYVILGRGKLIGPIQDIRFGDNIIKRVLVSRCLGLEIDDQLNWNGKVSEVIKAFTRNLNVLKSLYLLPVKGREAFYFKVIIPFVTYCITNDLELMRQDPHGRNRNNLVLQRLFTSWNSVLRATKC